MRRRRRGPTIAERRAATESVAAQPPPGTIVESADAGGEPAGMAETVATYLAGADPRHPYASPLYADLLEVWPEMPHVWHAFAGLLPESDQAIQRIGSWLQARCAGGTVIRTSPVPRS